MDPTWNSPDAWQKDGASITSVSNVKKGAWTTILKATETHNGKNTDVVIKQFAVPEEVLQDPARIALEREKFLTAARLQLFLTKPPAGTNPAKAWVKILRLDEVSKNPSFSMEKCGPSVQDLLDNKVQLMPAQLYSLADSYVLGLIELKDRAKRSHGNIKPSDVLSALPGENPPYKLADPAAKGEDHSANDLFSLGSILFQLIEGREWDPLNPISPTRGWQRFKGKRDRWMQFCNMLLNPNGCHETLADVRREAQRLRPASVGRAVGGVAGLLVLIGAGAGGYYLADQYWLHPKGHQQTAETNPATHAADTTQIAGTTKPLTTHPATQAVVSTNTATTTPIAATQGGNGAVVTTGPATTGPVAATGPDVATQAAPVIDAAVRAAFDAAVRDYMDASERWKTLTLNQRYDHSKSTELQRQAATAAPTETRFGDNAGYRTAMASLAASTETLNNAIDMAKQEEANGRLADRAALADVQQAAGEYSQTRAQWEAAAAKFGANENHEQSLAAAKEGLLPNQTPPTDPTLAAASAAQYRKAMGKLQEALKLVPGEMQAGAELAQALAGLEEAKRGYAAAQEKWAAADQTKGVDLTAARAAAEEAHKLAPEAVTGKDAESYRAAAALYAKASEKLTAALALVPHETATAPQVADGSVELAKANQAMGEKRYPDAMEANLAAAKLGNVAAMRNLGNMYENGQGTARNDTEAANWYRMAADRESPVAMVDLGRLFESGRGVEKDLGRAAQFYRRAAQMNNVAAMNLVGKFLEQGLGGARDYTEAMKWYRQAADTNDAEGLKNVGAMYDKGHGVTADAKEAMKWYVKAADQGSVSVKNYIGTMYYEGRGVPVNFGEAMKWYRQAADANDPDGLMNVGVMYDKGSGVREDPAQALTWYLRAADKGSDAARNAIGNLYYDGRGVKPNLVEAKRWYQLAADHQFAPALCNLGVLYDHGGDGIEVNHAEAFRCFQQGAELGDGQSMCNVASMYENGISVKRDTAKAIEWYRKALQSDDPDVRQAAAASLDKLKAAH